MSGNTTTTLKKKRSSGTIAEWCGSGIGKREEAKKSKKTEDKK